MTSFAPDIPEIPEDAIEFAKAVGELAAKYSIRDATITMRVDTGSGSRYRDKNVQQVMTAVISRVDGRGRQRTKIRISCEMSLHADVVNEPDSTS